LLKVGHQFAATCLNNGTGLLRRRRRHAINATAHNPASNGRATSEPAKELLKPTLQQQVPVAMPSRETTRM
jgi:hypothetical protein